MSQFLDPSTAAKSIRRVGPFIKELRDYKKLDGGAMRLRDTVPRLHDALSVTPFDAHYFYMSSWAMRRIHGAKPAQHVDVGGPVSLAACVAAVVPTVFVDYRPLEASIQNLKSVAGDLRRLPFRNGSIASLSCLHVAEHVGLGRYGDPLDPRGTEKAAVELARVLAPGGSLLFAVPVGRPRVHFNAHRIHSVSMVIEMFRDLALEELSAVTDDGRYEEGVQPSLLDEAIYACGLFLFVRR